MLTKEQEKKAEALIEHLLDYASRTLPDLTSPNDGPHGLMVVTAMAHLSLAVSTSRIAKRRVTK